MGPRRHRCEHPVELDAAAPEHFQRFIGLDLCSDAAHAAACRFRFLEKHRLRGLARGLDKTADLFAKPVLYTARQHRSEEDCRKNSGRGCCQRKQSDKAQMQARRGFAKSATADTPPQTNRDHKTEYK